MPDAPPSPPAGRVAAPGWLDRRLLLGVLLVLVSVVAGARVLAAADRTQQVWTASRDLAPGTTLVEGDLRAVDVRLFETGRRYLAAPDRGFVGYVVERGIAAGELVPVDAVQPPAADPLHLVSVPVLPGRYPGDLARGQRVDVWATPERPAGTGAPAEAPGSRLVLAGVPVHEPADVARALSAGTPESAVVLAVRGPDVGALVAAMTGGRIDLVRVQAVGDRAAQTTSAGAG